ncbi:hypothetical protein AF22_01858 [Klebsiella pneumoniae CHS 66]|nr:hypothetical protein AF22_01858 [Klebsiella pneumoniae CHS 66]SXT03980.1 Domain of uncharacterised function (DUF2825) [Klebsiella pneumoniae]
MEPVLIVFPTHVGVFPAAAVTPPGATCLPHARGGVSTDLRQLGETMTSSPRTWGCFRRGRFTSTRAGGFPTHVGVFPYQSPPRSYSICLPHARGGVSPPFNRGDDIRQSSPRTWGCFWNPRRAVPARAFVLSSPCTWGVSCEGSTSIGVLESSLHMWDLAISGILVLE